MKLFEVQLCRMNFSWSYTSWVSLEANLKFVDPFVGKYFGMKTDYCPQLMKNPN